MAKAVMVRFQSNCLPGHIEFGPPLVCTGAWAVEPRLWHQCHTLDLGINLFARLQIELLRRFGCNACQ